MSFLLLSSVLAAAGAIALVACQAAGDDAPAAQSRATRPAATRTAALETQTSTPAASPTVILPPGGDPPSGGDQPVGPPPPRAGTIAENAGVSPEFRLLLVALQHEIDAYHASTGTESAVAVTDMQTGQTISVRGNVAQRTGCTINMFALLAITSEFQAGRGNPDAVAGSVKIGIGASYPPQVRAFLDAVFGDFHRGEQRGRELMASWGMSASLFDHVPYYGNGTQNNLLTALETNLAWTKLYRGELFDAQWTGYALGKLHDIKPALNYIIPGRLPAGASVAHKIGYYADADGWVVADAGLVSFADRAGQPRSYVITYLSQRAPTEYAGYSFGAKLSRMVWDWMYPRYYEGLQPPTPASTPVPPTRVPTNTPRPTRTHTPGPTRTPTAAPPTHTSSPTPPIPTATP